MGNHKCVVCQKSRDYVSVFAFPKDRQRLESWTQKLTLETEKIGHNAKVCTDHFDISQFTTPRRSRLKKNAEPKTIGGDYEKNPSVYGASCNMKLIMDKFVPIQPSSTSIGSERNGPIHSDSSNSGGLCIKRNQVQHITNIVPQVSVEPLPSMVVLSPSEPSTLFVLTTPTVSLNPATEVNQLRYDNLFYEHTALKRKLDTTSRKLRSVRSKVKNLKSKTAEEVLDQLFGDKADLLQLIKSQYRRIHTHRTSEYSHYDKSIALTIYQNSGKRGYETLRKLGLELPCPSSLTKWMQHVHLNTGVNESLLNSVKGFAEKLQ